MWKKKTPNSTAATSTSKATPSSTTRGMPLVVELGVAFDVLVAAVLFGVFFFHI